MTHFISSHPSDFGKRQKRARERDVKEHRENGFAPLHLGVKLAGHLDFNIKDILNHGSSFLILIYLIICF